jgi:LRR receptor-like serine/threonine-protein kinase FLS2
MLGWFFIFVFSLDTILSQRNLSPVEFNALYDLYSATNGPSWVYYPSNTTVPWNFSNPVANPCADLWQGLTCECTVECKVIRLVLNGHNLTGTIPGSIGDFVECIEINLSDNFIYSQFPNTIRNMAKLVDLIVSNNFLTGSFPSSLGSIPSLLQVDFSRNFIEWIPESFYNGSSQIEILSLSDNLLAGSISPQIDRLKKLQSLRLEFNSLNGSIPASIGNFKNLTDIFLTVNLLTGEIPKTIGNLETLQLLELSYNLLQSTFPPEIGNLSSLTHLLMNSNDLYGRLPLSIEGLINLNYLDLVDNLFSGSLPSTFPSVQYLGTLLLGTNSFTGEINFLSSFYYITVIELLRNFFQGQVSPMIFGNQNSSVQNHLRLFQFATEYNLLSGPIPLTNRTSIGLYQVTGNYFTGTIPSSTDYANVVDQMIYFSVGSNYLHGSIPEIFLLARTLTNLNVSNNLLSGSLSFTSDLKADFNQLNCENNFLTGTLSPNIGNFTNLVTLTLANNYFTGTIPFMFHNLNNLNTLTLNENNFRGSMEVLLSKTLPTNLTTIDLANNEFTGSIPNDFFLNKSASLETFVALSNCLTGSLPDGICHATKLVNLVLDGLSTAENCRIQLLNNIPLVNSFTLRNTIEGSVPTCVYSMPFLMTLHLSGNGLTGSVPDSLSLSSSLTDVTLSHNNLIGTIPDSFQQKYWWNLDLSYNKIAGTLSSSSFGGLNSINSSLSLEVNRLSGEVPSALLDLESISILNGNIFECNLQGSNLPVHDPDYNSYSCGSDSVNDVLYLWLVIISSIVALLVVLYILRNIESENENCDSTHGRIKSVVLELHLYYRKIAEYSQNNPTSNIAKLHFCFKNLRKTIIILASILLFVFIPAYVILTTFYQSYDIEYVWNVSAVLLSSSTAALILFILFLLFSTVVYFILIRGV